LVEIYPEPDTHSTVMHLVRIDAASFTITASRVPAIAVVAGDGQVWVQAFSSTNGQEDARCVVGQVDPATGRLSRTAYVTLGSLPGSSGDGYNNPPFAVADGRIWSASDGLQRTTL